MDGTLSKLYHIPALGHKRDRDEDDHSDPQVGEWKHFRAGVSEGDSCAEFEWVLGPESTTSMSMLCPTDSTYPTPLLELSGVLYGHLYFVLKITACMNVQT